jgi:CrcB protein
MLAVAGGALGSGARFLVNVGAARWLGVAFPWATLIVNVAGSLAMGLLVEYVLLRHNGSPELRSFLATGILGGFTTFSAFSLDVATLADRGYIALAVLYVIASVAVSIAALYAGIAIARGQFS